MTTAAETLPRKRSYLITALILAVLIFMSMQFHISRSGNRTFLDIRIEGEVWNGIGLLDISFLLTKSLLLLGSYLWLYPKFMRQRLFGRWLAGTLVLMLGVMVFRYVLEQQIFYRWFGVSNYPPDVSVLTYIQDNTAWLLPWVVIGTIIPFTGDWLRMKKDRQQLEAQRSEAELALLKSQLNPHFLFNTLNSIYSLAYQRSDKAPDAILKLSEVLRYLLYDSEDRLVPMDKELQYLRSFIDLQKARFKETIYADLLVTGDAGQHQIIPVLLIAFVENAFKHGELTDPADPVLIQITIEKDRLHMITQNRISTQQKDETGGIGIPNIRRRLELMYPGRHTLATRQSGMHYICELELQLLPENK